MTQEAHTPEPWHVDAVGCHNDYRLRVCEPMRNGFPLATIAQFEFNWRDAGQFHRQISYKEAEGNARRAAACVNALAGIPIEAIESGVVAELVEALRAIDEAQQATDDAVEHHERAVAEGWRNDPTGSGHVSESNRRADKAWQRANDLRRNALAKLEASK